MRCQSVNGRTFRSDLRWRTQDLLGATLPSAGRHEATIQGHQLIEARVHELERPIDVMLKVRDQPSERVPAAAAPKMYANQLRVGFKSELMPDMEVDHVAFDEVIVAVNEAPQPEGLPRRQQFKH